INSRDRRLTRNRQFGYTLTLYEPKKPSMQLISCHDGRLLTLEAARLQGGGVRTFGTGLEALDALAPGGAFGQGAIHELIYEPKQARPLFVATLLARGAMELTQPDESPPGQTAGVLIWSDPGRE